MILSRIVAGIMIFSVLIGWPPVSAETGRKAPAITNETWLNSSPLYDADLTGKVVMVEFWTFGCYNCRNIEPYVKQWYLRYADQGFVVIGVHSPEFSHERDVDRVRRYVQEQSCPSSQVLEEPVLCMIHHLIKRTRFFE